MVYVIPLLSILAIMRSARGAEKVDANEVAETRFSVCDPNAGSVYQFDVETLDGKNTSMNQYSGGYTGQYLDFNPLASRYNSTGMHVAGFPCNQFDLQEPGKNHEILNGIRYVRPGNNYQPAQNVHIYGKLEVNGNGAHPMYKFLKAACPATGKRLGTIRNFHWDEIHTNDIVWNFEKFIVDQQGRPRYRFHPAAWDESKFVEKYLLEVMSNEKINSVSASPVSQSPPQYQYGWFRNNRTAA